MQGIKHRGVKVLKGAGQLQQLGRVGLQLNRRDAPRPAGHCSGDEGGVAGQRPFAECISAQTRCCCCCPLGHTRHGLRRCCDSPNANLGVLGPMAYTAVAVVLGTGGCTSRADRGRGGVVLGQHGLRFCCQNLLACTWCRCCCWCCCCCCHVCAAAWA